MGEASSRPKNLYKRAARVEVKRRPRPLVPKRLPIFVCKLNDASVGRLHAFVRRHRSSSRILQLKLCRLSGCFARGKHESSLDMHRNHSKPSLSCYEHHNERSPFKLIRTVLAKHRNTRFDASDNDLLTCYLCQSSSLSVGQISKLLDFTLDDTVRLSLVVWINDGGSAA